MPFKPLSLGLTGALLPPPGLLPSVLPTMTPPVKGANNVESTSRRLYRVVRMVVLKVLPWVVVGAGGLGAGKTSGAGTRGVSLDVVIGGRTGHSDTNGGESSDNRSKIHADCGPAENPSL